MSRDLKAFLLVLILIFNLDLFYISWYWFVLLFVGTALAGVAILFFRNRQVNAVDDVLQADQNPLEFRTALVFTLLFVILSVLTFISISRYGTTGLNVMSYLVGLVDIDPFLISLFAGKFDIPNSVIIVATLQAMVSNNVVKMGYALFFGSKRTRTYLTFSFLFVILLNFLLILIL